MKLSLAFFLSFFLLPAVALAQSNDSLLVGMQIFLVAIAAGASIIATIMIAEILKIVSVTKIEREYGKLQKCTSCGKNYLAKTYEGVLLVGYECKRCGYQSIREKPKKK